MKIAIIGASQGQLPLCKKAKEMGIKTLCFAWEQGAICKEYVDKFYPISILEKEKILTICKEEHIDGIVSNASDITALTVAYISEKMGLHGISSATIHTILDKSKVRSLTKEIEGLKTLRYFLFKDEIELPYPLVVKPVTSAGKKGLTFVPEDNQLVQAVNFARQEIPGCEILIEEFISGKEVSVETISFEGNHFVLQITDKENTGSPHFAELGHHQPSLLKDCLKRRLTEVSVRLLTCLNYYNGASHIEFKISEKGDIYLIEINPRGGGDHISSELVYLSTGYDYLKGMIEVCTGRFTIPKNISESRYSGIYYLCKQTEGQLPFFRQTDYQPWLIKKDIESYSLQEISTNYNRNGYVIYQWDHKIQATVNEEMRIKRLNDMPDSFQIGLDFLNRVDKEENYSISSQVNLEEWLSKILDKADVLVYMDNQSVCGWFVLYCNDYNSLKAYGAGLHVLENYRGKDISKKLLEAVIFLCRLRKFELLWFYCNNPIAINLFCKYRFVEKKKEKVKELGNEVYSVMELNLMYNR